MTDVPVWAKDLVEKVCWDRGIRPPRVVWRMRDGEQSTGTWYREDRTIRFREGRSGLDQRLVLLHELAHVIRDHRTRGRVCHDIRFWRLAFDLYEEYDIEFYGAEREWGYMAKARQVIRERGLPEPSDILDRTFSVDPVTHRQRMVS